MSALRFYRASNRVQGIHVSFKTVRQYYDESVGGLHKPDIIRSTIEACSTRRLGTVLRQSTRRELSMMYLLTNRGEHD